MSAESIIPPNPTLETLRAAAKNCQACELWKFGTQTVFGEGAAHARIMLVGEQPGDKEDLAGHPFVGPAGRLLDEVLAEAKIDRKQVYVTNAVKHFKWMQVGPRRLHKKPNRREMEACRPWLEHELALVKPAIVVCLGATAAQSMLGADFRLTQHRGEFIDQGKFKLIATLHPSAILRANADQRDEMRASLVADLRAVVKRLRAAA